MSEPSHPMQPVVLVDGIVRFKQNGIVRMLTRMNWSNGPTVKQKD